MSALLIAGLTLIAGLIGLVISAHYFVGGSAALAKHLGMRPGLIGLTVVAFGTSAPEIFVSVGAALRGVPDLGIGNAIGSNTANIGLVLGLTALLTKLPVNRELRRMEIPLLALATGLAVIFLSDYMLSRNEGYILLAGAVLMPIYIFFYSRRSAPITLTKATDPALADDTEIPDLSLRKSLIWLAGGLCVLLFCAHLLVTSATDLATYFGVSPMIIGLTIVALGTSLPELAASIASALKGHPEMAIGNILGSNILNIFAVMSLPGILKPSLLDASIFSRDVAIMVGLTLLLIAIILIKSSAKNASNRTIGSYSGMMFLAIYAAYYAFIFIQ